MFESFFYTNKSISRLEASGSWFCSTAGNPDDVSGCCPECENWGREANKFPIWPCQNIWRDAFTISNLGLNLKKKYFLVLREIKGFIHQFTLINRLVFSALQQRPVLTEQNKLLELACCEARVKGRDWISEDRTLRKARRHQTSSADLVPFQSWFIFPPLTSARAQTQAQAHLQPSYRWLPFLQCHVTAALSSPLSPLCSFTVFPQHSALLPHNPTAPTFQGIISY